jgi:hypothetical protein
MVSLKRYFVAVMLVSMVGVTSVAGFEWTL